LAIDPLKKEEETLSNTNLQVAEAPVVEEAKPEPVVEESKGTVPRVGESEGFVDTELVSQTPVVNTEEMPTENFVSADMSMPTSQPVIKEEPTVVEDAPTTDTDTSETPLREQMIRLQNERGSGPGVQIQPPSTDEEITRGYLSYKDKIASERVVEANQQGWEEASYTMWEKLSSNKNLLAKGVSPIDIMFDLDGYYQLALNNDMSTAPGSDAATLIEARRKIATDKQTMFTINGIKEKALDWYIERDGEEEGTKNFKKDMKDHRTDAMLRVRNLQFINDQYTLPELGERILDNVLGVFDLAGGILSQEGSLRPLLPDFITEDDEEKEQYDAVIKTLEGILNNDAQMKILTDPLDNVDYIDSVVFPTRVPDSPSFMQRIRNAWNTPLPERLEFTPSRDLTAPSLMLPRLIAGRAANFINQMGEPGVNIEMEKQVPGYGRIIDNMAFWATLPLEARAESFIRKGFNTRAFNMFKDGGAEELLAVTDEINNLNAAGIAGFLKRRSLEKKKRKLSKVTSVEGLGRIYDTIERDVQYQAMAFGLGYTGLDLFGIERGSGGDIGGLLMIGIFGPSAMNSIYKRGKGIYYGATDRVDFYVKGGGTIDEFILHEIEKGDSRFLQQIPDLKEKLPKMNEKEKLKLIRLEEQEFRSIIRFGEVLKNLKDNKDTFHIYEAMQANLEEVTRLKDKMSDLLDIEKLRGKQFVDSNGTVSVYDEVTLERVNKNITLFLDEYINSEVIRSIRQGLTDNNIQLNFLGRVDRNLFKDDVERFLKLDTERQDNLVQIFKMVSPVLRDSGEAGSELVKQIDNMIFKNQADVSKARARVDEIDNIVTRQTEQENALLGGEGDVMLTKFETEANLETQFINEIEFKNELQKNPIVSQTASGEQLDFGFDVAEAPSKTKFEAANLIKPKSGSRITIEENAQRQKELFKDDLFSFDQAKFNKLYDDLRAENASARIDTSKVDVEEGLIGEPTLRESAREDTTVLRAGGLDLEEIPNKRTTDEAGDLIITYKDGATETIPARSKLPLEDNIPSDIRPDEGVYTFGRGVDADRQEFPSTEGYETLESFITSTDETLAGFDTKQRLRFWRISRDGAEPLKEGYIPRTELDANDPFVIQNDLINLENQMKGVQVSEEDLARFENIHGGKVATQTDLESVDVRRTERIREDSEVKTIEEGSEADILDKIIAKEKEVLGKDAEENVSRLPVPKQTLGAYLFEIRKKFIDSFDSMEDLSRYINSRVTEIDVMSGTSPFSIDDKLALEQITKKINDGIGDEGTLLRQLKSLGNKMLIRQEGASVLVTANDIHRIRSHFNTMAFKNYNTPKGNEFRSYGSGLSELMDGLFPQYSELNKQYRIEFAEIYKAKPYAKILNKDSSGFPTLPEDQIIDAFIDAEDTLQSIKSFKRALNLNIRADGQTGTTILGSPTKIKKDRNEAFDLFFYNVSKRIERNVQAGKPPIDENLQKFLQAAKEEKIFSSAKNKDLPILLEKLITLNPRRAAFTRSQSQSIANAKSRLNQAIDSSKVKGDDSFRKIKSDIAKAGNDEEELLKVFEGLSSEQFDFFVLELTKEYPETYKLSNLTTDRANQPAYILKEGKDFIDPATGNIDAKKLVERDLREIINQGMIKRFVQIDNSSRMVDITREVYGRTDYVTDPGKITKTQPFTIRGGLKQFKRKTVNKQNTVLRRGETLKVDEFNSFIKDNRKNLEKLYGVEHVKNLEDISKMGMVISGDTGTAALKGVPATMQVPAYLSRLFAWQRGVVGTKYLVGEVGINRFRKTQADAIKSMIENPDGVILLNSIFDSKNPPTPADLTKAVGFLKAIFVLPESRTDNELLAFVERMVADSAEGKSIKEFDEWAQEQIDNKPQ